MSQKLTYEEMEIRIKALEKETAERKRAEAALRESEEKFRMIFENANDEIAYVALDGTVLDVNDKIEDIFGYTPQEVIGKNFAELDFIGPEGLEKCVKLFEEKLAGQPTEMVELEASRLDGSKVFVEVNPNIVKKDGEITGFLNIIRDITGRKQAEADLSRAQELISKAFFRSPVACAIMKIDTAKIVEVNDAFEQLTEYKKEDVIERSTRELNLWLDEVDRKKMVNALKEKGFFRNMEMKICTANGKIRECLFSAEELLYFEEPHIISMAIDISDYKQTEERKKELEVQLHQAQKIESLGTLAGGIAHDFNNILYPIIGYTEMTMDDVPEESVAKDNLREILKAAKRARDLVQQILVFSRQSGDDHQPLKVQIIVKEALKLLRASIPVTIEIKQQIDNECGNVMGAPSEIHQIIINLCTNAYHSMQETGGTLSVGLREVDIHDDDFIDKVNLKAGRYIELIVGDTGSGMNPDILARIFDPYYTTKEPGKGTGLGLSVVHGIVEDHNGDIMVSSTSEKGSMFHVYLPLIEAATIDTESESTETALGNQERILLVDDELQIISMEKLMLKRLGYKVTSRTSSVEALEAFKAQPEKFDLVIADMTMPNMTGDNLAQKMIEIRNDIPIILCTGFSESIDEEKAKLIGIKALILKPVVKNELAKTIRWVLDQNV